MNDFVKDQPAFVAVRLLNDSFAPVAGILSGGVVATVTKGDGTTVAVVVDGVNTTWTETTTGAFSGQGCYVLKLAAAYVDVLGMLMVAVTGGTGKAVALGWVSADVQAGITAAVTAIKGAGNKDLTEVATAIAALPTTAPDNATIAAIQAALARALGLMYENGVQDQQVYDSRGSLTSARVRLYDSAAHASAATSTGLVATYAVEGAFDPSGACTLFRMTRTA